MPEMNLLMWALRFSTMKGGYVVSLVSLRCPHTQGPLLEVVEFLDVILSQLNQKKLIQEGAFELFLSN